MPPAGKNPDRPRPKGCGSRRPPPPLHAGTLPKKGDDVPVESEKDVLEPAFRRHRRHAPGHRLPFVRHLIAASRGGYFVFLDADDHLLLGPTSSTTPTNSWPKVCPTR